MTTIAADARAGIMAADSDWTDGDACGVTRKVFRIRLGTTPTERQALSYALALAIDKAGELELEASASLAVFDGTDWHESRCASTSA